MASPAFRLDPFSLRAGQVLAGLRSLIGFWLFLLVLPLLDRDAVEQTATWVVQAMGSNPYPICRWLFSAVVQPHLTTMLGLMAVGQLVIGVNLIIGFLTRPSAALLAISAAVLLVFIGHVHWGVQHGLIWGMVVLSAIAFSRAGAWYGADRILFSYPVTAAPTRRGQAQAQAHAHTDEDTSEPARYERPATNPRDSRDRDDLATPSRRPRKPSPLEMSTRSNVPNKPGLLGPKAGFKTHQQQAIVEALNAKLKNRRPPGGRQTVY
ncbi:MAG: hypothetical protein KC474_03010 [Cyanobacteria bacterium HKST-UBA04]|nr:hypothetical protein [Cyanobacteria bacterium HKST-UBA04]